MISQWACFFKNDGFWFLICFTSLDIPIVDLNSPFSTIKADYVGIFQDDKFLLERESLMRCGNWCAYLPANFRRIIVFVPIEIYAFTWKLLKFIFWIKECYFHIMWKYEHATQNVIVVIVPDVFVSEWNNSPFIFDINNFKAFFLQISDC